MSKQLSESEKLDFSQFKQLMQRHVAAMLEVHTALFVADVEKDKLWETYLDSFPLDHNKVFRERREHDCSCCRQFIKAFGNVVAITRSENEIVTIWDFETNDPAYGPVVTAMQSLVRSAPIRDVFVTKESAYGTDSNHEQCEDGTVRTWEHFRVDLPSQFVTRSSDTVGNLTGKLRDVRNVFKRSLKEISMNAIEAVLDLISQNSLYKGEEWQGPLSIFRDLHEHYHSLAETGGRHDCWLWKMSVEVGPAIGKIRNHSIGVLLTDVTEGMELDAAVRKYESIVAPTNYKRPKAVFTKKMVQDAEAKLSELGLLDSLGRRYATIEDITVNNILFANRDSLKQMGSVFDELASEVATDPKAFSRVEEVPVNTFVEQILPRCTNVEAFLENRHAGNFVSLIAPQNPDSPTLFKWDNAFSWAYAGNITDSMKERVKAKGGNVEGVLRFSIQWNENGDNQNDFDAHCTEPGGNEIYYRNMESRRTGGELDVDIIYPARSETAVENIAWPRLAEMQHGNYQFRVHNYTHRGGRSGFSAQIEFDGQVHEFEYNQDIAHKGMVEVAEVTLNGSGFHLKEKLPSSTSSRKIWNLDTNQFQPVSVLMFSPNYWDGQKGIGHRHYLFILNGCINDIAPNGFFNEFLREDLMEYKRVFEALGSKMRVAPSDDQLSGLGFSATKRNSVICKLQGHVSRTIKVVF